MSWIRPIDAPAFLNVRLVRTSEVIDNQVLIESASLVARIHIFSSSTSSRSTSSTRYRWVGIRVLDRDAVFWAETASSRFGAEARSIRAEKTERNNRRRRCEGRTSHAD